MTLLGRIEPRFLDLPPEVAADLDARQPEVLLPPRPGHRHASPPTSSSPTATPPTTAPPSSPATPASSPPASPTPSSSGRTTSAPPSPTWPRSSTTSPSTTSSAPRASASPASPPSPARSPRTSAPTPTSPSAPPSLAKADLASQMVYEFPELQGTMGRYYAERAGEPPAVAAAAAEHYSPLGPSDAVPTAPVSVAVALADKLDTLTGFWAIDEKPTGSKDPFALRRAALGVIRISVRGRSPSACADASAADDPSEPGVDGGYARAKAEAPIEPISSATIGCRAECRARARRGTSSPSSPTASRSTSATRASATTSSTPASSSAARTTSCSSSPASARCRPSSPPRTAPTSSPATSAR